MSLVGVQSQFKMFSSPTLTVIDTLFVSLYCWSLMPHVFAWMLAHVICLVCATLHCPIHKLLWYAHYILTDAHFISMHGRVYPHVRIISPHVFCKRILACLDHQVLNSRQKSSDPILPKTSSSYTIHLTFRIAQQ